MPLQSAGKVSESKVPRHLPQKLNRHEYLRVDNLQLGPFTLIYGKARVGKHPDFNSDQHQHQHYGNLEEEKKIVQGNDYHCLGLLSS